MTLAIFPYLRRAGLLLFAVLLLGYCPACNGDGRDRVVQTISRRIPPVRTVNVFDSSKFVNDLKLSPFWKVEKDRQGQYEAHARFIDSELASDNTGNQFLFELLSEPAVHLPKDWRIGNHYIPGHDECIAFSAFIVFTKPTNVDFCQDDGSVTLKVLESHDSKIGLNSWSTLALRLSTTHEIYLCVREQGKDKNRTTTFTKLVPLVQAVASLLELPARYRVEDQYNLFFKTFFQLPWKEIEVKRLPGIQDSDTFYGYMKSKPDTSYEAINIRISHPVYCGGECTRDYSRLQKAEYLGKPYFDDDALFFLIEDNTVYLRGQYDEQFGTFSGKSSFEGTLEILNDAGKVLYQTKDRFKGWER